MKDPQYTVLITRNLNEISEFHDSPYEHLRIGDLLEGSEAFEFTDGMPFDVYVEFEYPEPEPTPERVMTHVSTIYELRSALVRHEDAQSAFEHAETKVDFLQNLLCSLCPNATMVKQKIIEKLISEYKKAPSSGVLNDDDIRSQWGEYGKILSDSEHSLYELVRSEIRSDVDSKHKKLSFLERFALIIDFEDSAQERFSYIEKSTTVADLLCEDWVVTNPIVDEIADEACADYEVP